MAATAVTKSTTLPRRDSAVLLELFRTVRRFSERLTEPLEPEDVVIQSMPDVSPTRWHLAHTTWFFENFVWSKVHPQEEPHDPAYGYLFNSYYNSVGKQFPRSQRGVLSRPTLREVMDYRHTVDERVEDLLSSGRLDESDDLLAVVEIGLHHEQQHQELILTDIKHVFSCNPLRPVYHRTASRPGSAQPQLAWQTYREQLETIGHDGGSFAFDNEGPRHRRWIEAFELASRLVTNSEYLEFIEDSGYARPELWLSDGWSTVVNDGWAAPLYWEHVGDRWQIFTLGGMRDLDPAEPVCHVSYYEADAFARWAGAWLPTEAAWETAACDVPPEGNFVESERFHPAPVSDESEKGAISQIFGDVWEWTCSPYCAYPGYRPATGALGEYNGKFMCNQMVLRGGSCATAQSHIRPTYRNFFPPSARWQFSGIRLAREPR
ncbi:MAG: ergothioneine biosynthesis protein EgtB [Pirellulales bacterium]